MEIVKIIGIGLIATILIIIIKQYKPEFALYISIVTGILIILLVVGRISGIIEIIKNLANTTSVNNAFIGLLIKITGIAILTEYIVSICKDSGENAIASKIDMGGKIIIVSMSVPIISNLLESIVKILP